MAGRISETDLGRVREANRIDQVVAEYVALRPVGGGNLKGLCPFHDEKTPSFQVSPNRSGGRYHCFGCDQGGDVFEFVMQMEHLEFMEAVHRLADRAGVHLTLVQGGSSTREERGTRSRLIAANRAAAEFYVAQLRTDAAGPARAYLAERGFDDAAAAHFGCGYAPAGWDALTTALTAQGFSLQELEKAGLSRAGERGHIDRFHRRLLWPIRDASGDVVGFGARRLYDDDRIEAKYVNTAETVLYRKSQVLFGLDLAKRDIGRQRRAVVVEGYTDVMAMHLAGITTAVASCGTAFGDEHISVLRRYLADGDLVPGEVVYTFDGDAAGQKAALKAFDSDQRFAARTFVCIAPDGMDPCELRQSGGDAALRELLDRKQPLFAFAIRERLGHFDLDTAEGRVAAAAATVPIVAGIKDQRLRDEYARQLAGWLGADHTDIAGRVRSAARGTAPDAPRSPSRPATRPAPARPAGAEPAGRPVRAGLPRADDLRLLPERELLKMALQQPALLALGYRQVDARSFAGEAYRRVHEAVTAAGGPAAALGQGVAAWITAVSGELPTGPLRTLVSELAVEPVNTRSEPDARYAGAILAKLAERVAAADERDIRSELQRAEASGDQERARLLAADLMSVSAYRRALAERANGGV
ncbi:DNA primase [Nakamurella endophytica]|uniref:DNA primase n=1 Tax=Nakamurella endophytica TaxID=1748367 RepID=A0A917T0A3_9ACTN|nr:DNA primase [Nakamurella endophytica]GGM06271.1 DNA primase [Nakamurella endophytica]